MGARTGRFLRHVGFVDPYETAAPRPSGETSKRPLWVVNSRSIAPIVGGWPVVETGRIWPDRGRDGAPGAGWNLPSASGRRKPFFAVSRTACGRTRDTGEPGAALAAMLALL